MITTSRYKILQTTSTQLRKTRPRKLVWAVALPLLALTCPTMIAKGGPGEQASAELTQDIAEPAQQVVLRDLPQVMAPARRPIEIPLRGPVFNLPRTEVAPTGVTGRPSPVPDAGGVQTTPGTNTSF